MATILGAQEHSRRIVSSASLNPGGWGGGAYVHLNPGGWGGGTYVLLTGRYSRSQHSPRREVGVLESAS